MNFDWKQFYLSAQGRVNRKQFCAFSTTLEPTTPRIGVDCFSSIFSLVVIVPAFLVYIKRWHDRDKSGWWMLIVLIPLVGLIWFLVELGFLPGTPGPNRFGPPPLD